MANTINGYSLLSYTENDTIKDKVNNFKHHIKPINFEKGYNELMAYKHAKLQQLNASDLVWKNFSDKVSYQLSKV